jgi:hypothetical protein
MMGPLAQPAFVDEDDGPAFFLGFFNKPQDRSCRKRRISLTASVPKD